MTFIPSLSEEFRRLEEEEDVGDPLPLTETDVIESACSVYLSIFALIFLVFLIVRPRYPHIYNIKKSYPAFYQDVDISRTPIADDAFGRLNWIRKVFTVSYDDIRDQCGMDACTTIRLLEFGVKLSLVGVVNSFFLFPIYAAMGNVVAESGQSDPVKEISLSNLGQGSSGTIATTFFAYILYGAAMYFIAKDYDWFLAHRHKYLSQTKVQNYSVYLSGLPSEMQSDHVVKYYFGNRFSQSAVLDAHVAVATQQLQKKVAERDALIPKLEHAINILKIKGEVPMHKTKRFGGKKVESVPTYQKELKRLNGEIGSMREKIYLLHEEREAKSALSRDMKTGESDIESVPEAAKSDEHLKQRGTTRTKVAKLKSMFIRGDNTKSKGSKPRGGDGEPSSAAFVTFSNLSDANTARQIVHQHKPWACVPVEPPSPEYVNWKNVGKSNKSKQIGELISLVLTTLLCIFWTVPVGFVAGISNVDSLTQLLPFLKEPVEKYDWFSGLMAFLAPLILVVFISLLPMILLAFVKQEGSIVIETYQHSSLFSKMAIFTLVQTFFISTISSTLFSSLQEIANNPSMVFALLAEALPSQSAFFISLILIQNLLSLGLELLRISPVAVNVIRKVAADKLGHNLTEKERNGVFMGLCPLDNPSDFPFGTELGGKTILALMVLYVYGLMSPITAYFTLLVFGAQVIAYRNQFIYIYPARNDSGGQLYINFTRISIMCLIVAETILFAVLLLKGAFPAAVLLVPLIITTLLFNAYFKRRHYSVSRYLPGGECSMIDRKNKREAASYVSLFKDAYQQPELKRQAAEFPENYFEIEPTSPKIHIVPYSFRQTASDDHVDKETNLYVDEFQQKSQTTSYTPRQPASDEYKDRIADGRNSHEHIAREKKHKKHHHKPNLFVDEFQQKSQTTSYTPRKTASDEYEEMVVDKSNSHEQKHKKHHHKHHHKKYRHKESLTDELEKLKIKDKSVKTKQSKKSYLHQEQLQESYEESYDDWEPKKTVKTDQSRAGYRVGRDPSTVCARSRRDP